MVENNFMSIIIQNSEAPTNAWLTLKSLSDNIFENIVRTNPHVIKYYKKLDEKKSREE